jgi:hypothetical protein
MAANPPAVRNFRRYLRIKACRRRLNGHPKNHETTFRSSNRHLLYPGDFAATLPTQ